MEGLEEDPGIEPIDLGVLAESFVEEVKSWREAVAIQVEIDAPVGEAIIETIQSDSASAEDGQTGESGPPNSARSKTEGDGSKGR